MATSEAITTISVIAGTAVSIYRFVTLAADSQYDHSGAQGDISGVCAESVAAAGDVFPMALPNGSTVKMEAGAAVAVNAAVASDATGRAITAVSGVGNFTGGRALTAASGAGEIIEVQLLVAEDHTA